MIKISKISKIQRIQYEIRTLISELEDTPYPSARYAQLDDELAKLWIKLKLHKIREKSKK